MRNILYVFALLILAISLINGQTINLDQTGNGHEVIIHQIGDNTINIEHGGTSQSADIYQEGMLNTANVAQTKKEGYETTPGNNHAVITQVGAENIAEINQISGSYNYGEIGQYGDRNKGIITQEAEMGFSNRNTAKIFQYGNNNEGNIKQIVWDDEAELIQKGDFNKAEINMTNSTINPSFNILSIYQEGMNNYALQGLTGTDLNGKIEQVGNNNNAIQSLIASRNFPKAHGEIIQHQNNGQAHQTVEEMDGYARIYQYSSDPFAVNYNLQIVLYNGTAIANVYGGNNYGSQIMDEPSSYSYIEERGTHNIAKTQQNGESFAYIQTVEESSYNSILIDQTRKNTYISYDNSASVYINGSYNYASILQEGNGNNAGLDGYYGIEIIGNSNMTEILQEGTNNSAALHLYGDGLEMRIEQRGDNITTSITQEN